MRGLQNAIIQLVMVDFSGSDSNVSIDFRTYSKLSTLVGNRLDGAMGKGNQSKKNVYTIEFSSSEVGIILIQIFFSGVEVSFELYATNYLRE